MKATFFQDEFKYSFEFNGVDNTELSKIIGTSCNRFFRFAMTCKKTGVKSAKFNEPIGLLVENEDHIILDSLENEEFATSLKLQRTPGGLKRFANRTLDIVTFALSEVEILTVEDIK